MTTNMDRFITRLFIFLLYTSIGISKAYSGQCSKSTCKRGTCYTVGNKAGLLCSCPIFRTGPKCEKESYPCSSCEKSARVDCIGLPDGTARCICTKWRYKKMKKIPTSICYYKKAKKNRQSLCKKGRHSCSPAQECVNYAQAGRNTQITCQCPAGTRRGHNCQEGYERIPFNGQATCTHIKGQEPICLCQRYGKKPGFCKPLQPNGRPPVLRGNKKTKGSSYSRSKPSLLRKPKSTPGSGRPPVLRGNKKTKGSSYFRKHYRKPRVNGKSKTTPGKPSLLRKPKSTPGSGRPPVLRGNKKTKGSSYLRSKPSLLRKPKSTPGSGRPPVLRGNKKTKGSSYLRSKPSLLRKHKSTPRSESYPCSSCKKTARVDCIGLPDGTARCICTKWKYMKMKKIPTSICYYKKAKKHRQKLCKLGKHSCSPAQECVNYAQDENKMQMTCQCPAGQRRGDNCREDYKRVPFDGQASCTQIKGEVPICLCQKYENQPGFCKPQQSSGGLSKPLVQSETKKKISAGGLSKPLVQSETKKKTSAGRQPVKEGDKKTSSSGQLRKTPARDENEKPKSSGSLYKTPVRDEIEKTQSSSKTGVCSKGTCKKGSCHEVGNKVGFFCSCPMFQTGPRCEKKSYPCSSCTEERKLECIGLPDGTARCICTLWKYKTMKKIPTSICYYKKAKKHRQKLCKSGKHSCSPDQQCVNYAQDENKMQMTCQCPAGHRRGDNCQEDYKSIVPDGETSCTQTAESGVICLCNEYGRYDDGPGFCKVNFQDKNFADISKGRQPVVEGNKKTSSSGQLHKTPARDENEKPKSSGSLMKTPVRGEIEKTQSSGKTGVCSKGTCNKGSCNEVGNIVGFYCSCPMFQTGPRCEKKSYPCSSCKEERKLECIGLPDGTARCICTLWKYKTMKKIPTSICYYKKAKKHRQKLCKSGKHSCSPDQQCVNYAEDENKMQMTCQCPAGHRRGDNCQEDYKSIVPDGETSCTQTAESGVVCLCNEYGRYDDGPGFCKVNFQDKSFVGKSKGFSRNKDVSPASSSYTAAVSKGSNTAAVSKGKEDKQSSRANKTNVMKNITSAHLLDPDWKKVDPCSSQPCLHAGICGQHPSKQDDFTCVCPLGRTGKLCDKKIADCDRLGCKKKRECLSTPEGAVCICTAHFQEQMCSIKMRNVTEWEKLKLVMAPRKLHTIEIAAIILLVFVGLILIYLISHCIRVSSKRKEYEEKYEKVVKKGEVPTAPLPDWLDVSNDLAKQSLCCGASKLPTSFAPKKKKKKKDKKKKKGTDETKDKNENSPLWKRRFGYQRILDKSEKFNSNVSVLKKSRNKSTNNTHERTWLTTKLKEKHRDDIKKSRKEYVKQYIKNHQKYFGVQCPSVTNLEDEKYLASIHPNCKTREKYEDQ
ncbi:uncharacterized protein LOC123559779 [Mercenaria mercenaria]|uniref:uncharacterized protein LOC123559779 n=1 Tax=Mercenaria mercenaria TaxID=6596 RepID=UPI00234F18A4|nr:uncharacterized protein LOC123559779 [Mercenaria mercenaria]